VVVPPDVAPNRLGTAPDQVHQQIARHRARLGA